MTPERGIYMNLLFEKACKYYLEYTKTRLKIQSYENVYLKFKNHIINFFKDKKICEITEFDYLQFQTYIKSLNHSYSFEKSIHSLMNQLYKYLMTYHNVTKNIPERVGMYKDTEIKQQKEMQTWSVKEFKKFIQVVNDKVYHALFCFLFYTGCRKGEALALKFKNIDLLHGIVYINSTITKRKYNNQKVITSTKTKKSTRKIRIDIFLRIELYLLKRYYIKKYKDCNINIEECFVFGCLESLSTSTLERKKNKYCDQAHVKRIRIHDFRHSYATILYNKRISIKVISSTLGHSDVSTTINTYVHSSIEDEKKVLKTLHFLRLF